MSDKEHDKQVAEKKEQSLQERKEAEGTWLAQEQLKEKEQVQKRDFAPAHQKPHAGEGGRPTKGPTMANQRMDSRSRGSS